MDNLKEYEKVAEFYERADKIYDRLVKAMFEGEVGGLDTSTVLYVPVELGSSCQRGFCAQRTNASFRRPAVLPQNP